MNKYRTRFLMSVCSIFISYTNCVFAEEKNDEKNLGAAIDGVRISLTFDKDKYAPSEHIKCKIVIQNTNDEDFTFRLFEPLSMFEFKITDAKKNAVEPTSFGKKLLSVPQVAFESKEATLKKGEAYIIEIAEFNRIYDLSIVGEYKVSVSINLSRKKTSFDLESNKAAIAIEEAKDYKMFSVSQKKLDK